ncbi:hypothetical protein PIB30_052230 [Stylosanthes scabra]|uniref:Uncharacterized protein n=1 Tax=Stylosanthes scabra TaxID=79078 RepID=A0ABU6RI44_9FABA|nr:hypothetical protein [Stylosanthes scabra]
MVTEQGKRLSTTASSRALSSTPNKGGGSGITIKKQIVRKVGKDVRMGEFGGDIASIGIENQNLVEVFKQGSELVVENDNKIRFWHDVWVREGALKVKFPGLYIVAKDKESIVGECGWFVEWLNMDMESNM